MLAAFREPPVCSLASAFTVATSLRATHKEGQVYSDLKTSLPVCPLGEDLVTPGPLESGWAVRRLKIVLALFLSGLGISDIDLSLLSLGLGQSGSMFSLMLSAQ